MSHRQRLARLAPLALLLVLGSPDLAAQQPDWRIVKPSNTGVPGEEVRVVRVAPDGDIWVAARWPFWGEGGIGIYDRESEAWTVHANWETPLPSPFINDIEFEPSGVAWIATGGGLVRFDGQQWTVWDSANSPMDLDTVRDIALAPDGHVWINSSSSDSGGDAIWDFDGLSGWTAHRVPDQLPWEAPWTDLSEVFVDSRGHVWVCNDTLNGVAEYDGNRWVLRGTGLGRLDELAEDQFGNIWINAHGVGGAYAFYRWNGSSFTTYPFYSPTTLRADPEDGTVYFGNWGGEVVRTRDGGQTIEPWLSGLNQVFSLAPDPAGPEVWVGTIGAVGRFSDGGALLDDFNSYNTGMPWYWVERMTTDRDGFFWVATGEAGLSRFDGLRWRNWGAHNVGSEPYPFAGNEPMGTAYQDSAGVHWFGGNGIARWHSQTGTFDGFWNWQNNPGMGVTLFPFFAEDGAGNLFAAAEYGSIFRFDPQASLWVKEPVQPYAVVGLPGMAADSQGNVWVCAWFDLHKWDGSGWSKLALPHPDYLFDLGGVNAFAIGPDDVLWLGTVEGLVRYDGSAFTLYDTLGSPLPFAGVQGLDVRDDGLLGLSAYDFDTPPIGGVALVEGDPGDPANWRTWVYGSSPLPHYQVGAVAFDDHGDLWVSALSEGVAVLELGAPPAWQDLGGGTSGSNGLPRLSGDGTLQAGSTVCLGLEDGAPSAFGLLFLSTSSTPVPFLGGTLHPFPILEEHVLFTDGAGQFTVCATWPAGLPAGTTLYFQFGMADGSVPLHSATLTNGLLGTTP